MTPDDLMAIEGEAKAFLDKFVAAIHFAASNPAALSAEVHIPGAVRLVAALTKLVPGIGTAETIADLLITYGPTLYAMAHGLGFKPADGDELARLTADREADATAYAQGGQP